MHHQVAQQIWKNRNSAVYKVFYEKLAQFINRDQNTGHFIENNVEIFFNAHILKTIVKSVNIQENIFNATNVVNIRNNHYNKLSAKAKRILVHILMDIGCAMSCVIFEALIFETIEHAIEHFSAQKKLFNPEHTLIWDKIKNLWNRIGESIAHPFQEKSIGIWIFLAIIIISVFAMHLLTHKVTDLCFKKEKQQEKTLNLLTEIISNDDSFSCLQIYINAYLDVQSISKDSSSDICGSVKEKLEAKFTEINKIQLSDEIKALEICQFVHNQLPKIIEETVKEKQKEFILSSLSNGIQIKGQ